MIWQLSDLRRDSALGKAEGKLNIVSLGQDRGVVTGNDGEPPTPWVGAAREELDPVRRERTFCCQIKHKLEF